MVHETQLDSDFQYEFPVDVYSYAFVLYKMFSNDIFFTNLGEKKNRKMPETC